VASFSGSTAVLNAIRVQSRFGGYKIDKFLLFFLLSKRQCLELPPEDFAIAGSGVTTLGRDMSQTEKSGGDIYHIGEQAARLRIGDISRWQSAVVPLWRFRL
jgi:hypothetical protein